ncbi:thioredoxin family protein [Candidatus Halocynthiibacter alkanivorans]|jgi:thioredoxin-related protein|uniref:thioredoxin family protein n=1 Tax=Candidatus Halocynthiibacter alkanivorans TaxID=2267619 RepID=UPI000DF29655|nr:thioredoxin family protein [Candidatus Halocynthiibacter alkanivorans]
MKIISVLIAVLAFALPAQAAQLGDDGLYKSDWMRQTFKDLQEDLADANTEGKRLMLIVEQRGCIYCKIMHEEVYPDPQIRALLEDEFFVVQLNMFGDTEIIDFDGEVLSEKSAVRKWRLLFTPTVLFLPEEVAATESAATAAIAVMPGAFGKFTTLNMLNWVVEKGYLGPESFQRYHARKLKDQKK